MAEVNPPCRRCGHLMSSHANRTTCSRCNGCSAFLYPEPDGKVVQKWADKAMFTSEPLAAEGGPRVYLLQAPNDPLGSIAAACKMYKGEVVRDLVYVTDAERRDYLQQILKTKLQMPFETVQFHFLLEGVTRSFTHQLVRQRTAAYAQESLRFAVVEDGFVERVALPPSIADTTGEYQTEYDRGRLSNSEQMRGHWDDALAAVDEAYSTLVNSGMPAEDARGLLPHNITTRVHYITNLRGLLDHAGNRLCTQAQFEWRLVFSRIAEAVRNYGRTRTYAVRRGVHYDAGSPVGWQYEELAKLFQPVCYTTGKCEFMANFDRDCSIRDRVQANASINRPSSEWDKRYTAKSQPNPVHDPDNPMHAWPWAERLRGDGHMEGLTFGKPVIPAIQPAEWLLNPGAAR